MSETIGGGGEWTALREALLAKAKEWRNGYGVDKNGFHCFSTDCASDLEALAAAAPAPPATCPECEGRKRVRELFDRKWPDEVVSVDEIMAAKDGQGAELLGPPSKAEREVATATTEYDTECPARDSKYQCTLDRNHAGPHKAHGFDRVLHEWTQPSLPEAVAGNASAPVGEKVRDTESFARGRHWELAEYENHLRSHNPQIGGMCSWCKLEKQWGRVVQPQPSGVGEPRVTMTDSQIKYMVDRFLSWRLPENFNPDAGISFKPYFNEHTAHPMKSEPTGTNLFDATQAEQMIRYLVDGMPAREVGEGLREALEKLANKWLEDKPYRDDQYWEGVRECGRQIIKLLDPAALAAPKPAPPAEPTDRQFAYRFLELPHHEQWALAKQYGVFSESDADMPDSELFVIWIKRLRERGKLEEFKVEIVRRAAERKPPR